MEGMSRNPYAIYVFCDGSMDLDSHSTGGIGFHFEYPEQVNLPETKKYIGKIENETIENLELRAINEGMKELLKLQAFKKEEFKKINTVIIITDRFALCDTERTNPFRIQILRKNKWLNHEGKPIKNAQLLDDIDKNRKKLSQSLRSTVSIRYVRRKFNKTADKLAKLGKRSLQIRKEVKVKTKKIGARLYDGEEIIYPCIHKGEEMTVHPFLKEFFGDQVEVKAEICKGKYQGKVITLMMDLSTEKKFHRKHFYKIEIFQVFKHHCIFKSDFAEVEKI